MKREGAWSARAAALIGALLAVTILLAAPRAAAAICVTGSDCDDANPCTDDLCNALNTCEYVPAANGGTTTCGLGVCEVTIATCRDGAVQVCTPLPPYAPTDSNCNLTDDDCDGVVNDDYVPTPITCGRGVCLATGFVICQDGHEIDDCVPGPPLDTVDVTCDGLDDDCDGPVDEDILRQDTTCGIGICQASGNISCVEGHWVDTCVPGPPILPSDTNCNNIDSDCDGSIDEDYVPTPIMCGTGACRRSGLVLCDAGHLVDACAPGQPLAPVDLSCDGIDDDCDGAVDDDIVRQDTFCGIGICAASGNISCVEGHWVDTCVPRPPILPSDTNCNNIDSDCDGAIDEDYVPVVSVCGFAACRRTGIVTCQAGHEVDGCVPGIPLVETCNGIDDDCDGIFDNGGAALCDDGNTCNGIETCGGEIGCRAGIPDAQVSLSVPDDLTAISGGTVVVPVQAQAASGTQIALTLMFDPSILQPAGGSTAYLTRHATIAVDLSVPGQVHIALDAPVAFHGEGPIALVTFNVVGSAGQNTGVQLSEATIDGGAVSTCRDPGRVGVCAGVPVAVQDLRVGLGVLTTLTWSAGTPGDVYDIASGLLSTLEAEGSPIDAACLVDRVATNLATDQRALPPAGDGYYYVVRERSACGIGSYGLESSGDPRTPAVSCP